jgi:hypothetical protein
MVLAKELPNYRIHMPKQQGHEHYLQAMMPIIG